MIMMFITPKDFAKCRDYTPSLYGVRNSPILYLVGTLDRWNNSKQSEERDRVKHDLEKDEKVYVLDDYNRVIPINRNCLNQEVEYKIA